MATVLLISSIDTREKEIHFLKKLIENRGCKALVMDISMSSYREGVADYSCVDVARAAGVPFQEIAQSRDTNKNMALMIGGCVRLAKDLYQNGLIDGLAGLGGTSNITIVSLIMKEFPFGLPKLILTSSAGIPSYSHRFFADTDIAIFHSCVGLKGLNAFMEDVLSRFAGMIVGMVSADKPQGLRKRVSVALTEFKFSSLCSDTVMELLEQRGFEVVSFSATGTSDRIMEEMVSQGYFKGVIDLVPAGLSEALLGGNRASGLDRLDKELASGIPVILTPCGFDMLSCGPLDRRDTDPWWKRKRIASRKLFIPDRHRVQVKTTRKELTAIAKLFGEKLNRATGSVAVFVPLKGFSTLSKEGGPLHEPETDAVFLKVLKRVCDTKKVRIIPIDRDLDDPLFAEAIANHFLEIMKSCNTEGIA